MTATASIAHIKVTDVVMWTKHIDSASLRAYCESLRSEEEVCLEVDGLVGRWRRMRTGRDGRMVNGLRPIGPIKNRWMQLFEECRGTIVTVRPVKMADDFATSASPLMVEWTSREDEAAFADL